MTTKARGVDGDIRRTLSLGHTDDVNTVAYHPDGTHALSGSDDKTLRLWDLATGTCELVLEGHTGRVCSVAYHPDGTHALCGARENTVRLWDLATGICERVLEGHTDDVNTVAYHPDGTHALSGSDDKTLRLWDLATGTCELVLEGHTGEVLSVAYHPDGTHALSGSYDKSLRLWDLATGTCERVLEGHTAAVWNVAYHPDGTNALSGSYDTTLRLWDLVSGTCDRILEGHSVAVRSVAYHPDGTHALSGSDDKTLRLWDLATGTCALVLEGHTRSVHSVAYHPDGTHALSGSGDITLRLWELARGRCERVLAGHTCAVRSVAFHPDGTHALSGSGDTTVRQWDLARGACERVLEGHTDPVNSVAYHPDGTHALSGSYDTTVRLWDLDSGACERVLAGHTGAVYSVAYHPDGTQALSVSDDTTVRLWDLATGTCERVLEGHTGPMTSVTYDPDGTHALSGSGDNTVRLWDLASGTCERVLEGHTDWVRGVTYHPDGTHALSCSDDNTVRLWDLASGTCERVLEGHTGWVRGVAYHPDGTHALSGSDDTTLRLWDLATGTCERVLEGHTSSVLSVAYHPDDRTVLSAADNGVLRVWAAEVLDRVPPIPRASQVTYTNAKVVLVGESQAGKSGLAERLAHNRWSPSESTVGAWASRFVVQPSTSIAAPDDGVDREIWLWDFGGQADQRLIHQLYMADTSLAVLVFDGQRDDVVPRLWDWNRALAAAGDGFPKVLVAGRTDVNPVRLSSSQIEEFRAEAGFGEYFETSAKHDVNCPELRAAIVAAIDWTRVPWRSSPETFRRLREEILALRDRGRVLTSTKELRDWLPGRLGPVDAAELDAVIGLLAGPGAVMALGFGDYVLLQPELLNTYAQAVIRSLRDDPLETGSILEDRVLRGDLNFPPDFVRLPEAEERVVLLAMHKQLVERAICLRNLDPAGRRATTLVFPSYFRRERPDRPIQPQCFMTYRFSGYLDEIYATLVVRLHHTEPFESSGLWRNGADFTTVDGNEIGLRLVPQSDGNGVLNLHCDPGASVGDLVLFARYVHDHLAANAANLTRLRTYICPFCSTPVGNRATAEKKLLAGKPDIVCADCERRVPLWDLIEQQLASEEIRSQVAEMRQRAQIVLDSEARERVLVGDVVSIVANANQISREVTVSDHGIDMEIEFKGDDGRATGKKVYLQLKSGDSHLRDRKRDESRVFRIDKPRHADYWADQAFPVMLVVRDSEGVVEWMEIRSLLRQQRESGPWPATEIRFVGERLDVMSVRRWRDRVLGT